MRSHCCVECTIDVPYQLKTFRLRTLENRISHKSRSGKYQQQNAVCSSQVCFAGRKAGFNAVQGATWCFKGDRWTIGTEYLRLWGARYAPLLKSDPSRSASLKTSRLWYNPALADRQPMSCGFRSINDHRLAKKVYDLPLPAQFLSCRGC